MKWPLRPLRELVRIASGKTPSRNQARYWGGEVPWISPKDMKIPFISSSQEKVTQAAIEERRVDLLPAGVVLVVVRGMILAHTLPVALTTAPATINQDIKALSARDGLEPEFLFWMIRASASALLRETTVAGHGTKRLETDWLLNREIPLPPIESQSRVVERIREAMGRVEEIQSIAAERQNDCEALPSVWFTEEVEALRAKTAARSLEDLTTSIPSAMASGPFGSQLLHGEFVDEGHLVIGIANVQEHRFDPVRKWMIDDAKLAAMKRFQVFAGDVLVTVMGTVGRCCVVPEGIGTAVTSKHVYRIRVPKDVVRPHFLSALINFDRVTRRSLLGTAKGGVMPGLNGSKLKALRIPLPSPGEQDALAEGLERRLELRRYDAAATESDLKALRAAILRQAFAGEL